MVEVSHIQKKYGKKEVLRDITFQVNSGEVAAIVGKNGCGKSTLLQVLAGILSADKGDVLYFGQSTKQNKKAYKEYCGYVPQENPLLEELSVYDNLQLWGAGGKLDEAIIKQFQLEDMLLMPVEKLSGGMKRRVSILCAILHWPPILILDEPTIALDIYHKESIRDWMREYRKKKGIIIMATHDEKEIMEADRCFIMKEGILYEIPKGTCDMTTIREHIVESENII